MDNNKKRVDFNCNLGEIANKDYDKSLELVEYMSSVNISCGLNTGSPILTKNAVEYCKFKNKVIGASIELPKNTKSPLNLSADEIEAIVLYQLGAISSFAKAYSLNIEHVRPEGEMYNLASSNFDFSCKIANAIKKYSEWLVYYGSAGETLKNVSAETGVNIAQEIISKQCYNPDLSLNNEVEAISDKGLQLIRVRRLMNLSEVECIDKSYSKVDFDTVHFDSHFDGALELVKEANEIIVPTPVNFNKTVLSGWVE